MLDAAFLPPKKPHKNKVTGESEKMFKSQIMIGTLRKHVLFCGMGHRTVDDLSSGVNN